MEHPKNRRGKPAASDTRERLCQTMANNESAGAWHHQTEARAKGWRSTHTPRQTNNPSCTPTAAVPESASGETPTRGQAPAGVNDQAAAIPSAGPPAATRPATLGAGNTNGAMPTGYNGARTMCTTATQGENYNANRQPGPEHGRTRWRRRTRSNVAMPKRNANTREQIASGQGTANPAPFPTGATTTGKAAQKGSPCCEAVGRR